MKGVKGDADRQQDVEVRRVINDADAREQPLEVLQQKIPVFKKPKHAQVHAHAGDEPSPLAGLRLRFVDLTAQPKIHRRCGKEECREGRIPRAVKDVTRDHEQVLARPPGCDAPVERYDDNKENDKGKRIKKHYAPSAYIRASRDREQFLELLIAARCLAETSTSRADEPNRPGNIRASPSRTSFERSEGPPSRSHSRREATARHRMRDPLASNAAQDDMARSVVRRQTPVVDATLELISVDLAQRESE